MIKILGICGSLREGSYNKAALKAAVDLVPDGVELEICDMVKDLPLFNQDKEQSPPQIVKDFKQHIQASDAILLSTPEYNYSVSGVLKNAIDWASRPHGMSVWEEKPVGIMSASGSMLGGARAQYHLRQMFVYLNMLPLNRPEVIIPFASDKFDENGVLTDQHTKDKIRELLEALTNWTHKLQVAKGYFFPGEQIGTPNYGIKGGKQDTSK